MTQVITLNKSIAVHLKPKGEVCNRLKLGVKVLYIRKIEGLDFLAWKSWVIKIALCLFLFKF